MNERVNDFENIFIKCGKMYSEHPTTGRFSTVIYSVMNVPGIQTTSLRDS
jgi:hypothetical protein